MLQKVSFCDLKLVLLRIHLQIERWQRPSGGHANWSRLQSIEYGRTRRDLRRARLFLGPYFLHVI